MIQSTTTKPQRLLKEDTLSKCAWGSFLWYVNEQAGQGSNLGLKCKASIYFSSLRCLPGFLFCSFSILSSFMYV